MRMRTLLRADLTELIRSGILPAALILTLFYAFISAVVAQPYLLMNKPADDRIRYPDLFDHVDDLLEDAFEGYGDGTAEDPADAETDDETAEPDDADGRDIGLEGHMTSLAKLLDLLLYFGADLLRIAVTRTLPILIGAYTLIPFAKGYRNGSFARKLQAGYTKRQIFGSLITVVFSSLAACYASGSLLLWTLMRLSVRDGAPYTPSFSGILTELLYLAPCCLAVATAVIALCSLTRGGLKTAAIFTVLLGLSFGTGALARDKADEPEYVLDDMQIVSDIFGIQQDDWPDIAEEDEIVGKIFDYLLRSPDAAEDYFENLPMVENPDYPGRLPVALLKASKYANPSYSLTAAWEDVRYAPGSADPVLPPEYAGRACCCAAEAAVFTLAGYLIFKKRDLN